MSPSSYCAEAWALLGCHAKPFHDLVGALLDGSAEFVHLTQAPLRLDVALLSRFPIPLHRLGIALLDTSITKEKCVAEFDLHLDVTLLGKSLQLGN